MEVLGRVETKQLGMNERAFDPYHKADAHETLLSEGRAEGESCEF